MGGNTCDLIFLRNFFIQRLCVFGNCVTFEIARMQTP